MEEEGTAADEDAVVCSILAEIGINLGVMVPEAPMGAAGVSGNSNTATEPIYSAPQPMAMGAPSGGGGGGGSNSGNNDAPPPAPGAGGGQDNGLSELEARLNNLRRNE